MIYISPKEFEPTVDRDIEYFLAYHIPFVRFNENDREKECMSWSRKVIDMITAKRYAV